MIPICVQIWILVLNWNKAERRIFKISIAYHQNQPSVEVLRIENSCHDRHYLH